jgi:hypothetical protein
MIPRSTYDDPNDEPEETMKRQGFRIGEFGCQTVFTVRLEGGNFTHTCFSVLEK